MCCASRVALLVLVRRKETCSLSEFAATISSREEASAQNETELPSVFCRNYEIDLKVSKIAINDRMSELFTTPCQRIYVIAGYRGEVGRIAVDCFPWHQIVRSIW